jgi:putative intracellular protease/amidase
MNRPTGLWLGEVVHFADVLYKNGYDIDYISPEGGYTPVGRFISGYFETLVTTTNALLIVYLLNCLRNS